MCLAVPAQVVSIEDDRMATVELSGVARTVSLDLVPETKVGDYVIVHVGFAIQRLDEVEARETLSLLDELVSSVVSRKSFDTGREQSFSNARREKGAERAP